MRKSLFWDIDPETIDLEKNARYVIERIFDYGKDEEVRWLFQQYGKERIKFTFNRFKIALTPKSRTFWNAILNGNSSEEVYNSDMKVLNYSVKIHTAEEGGFWAEVPALPGCFTQGETLDEVTEMAKKAIEGYLEGLVRHGERVPVEERSDVVGVMDVQVRMPSAA